MRIEHRAADAKGARRGRLPVAIGGEEPMRAARVPSAEGWLHEIAHAGARRALRVERGRVTFADAGGASVPARLAKAIAAAGVREAWIEGVLDEGGTYWAHDLLHVDGVDLRGVALRERKALLREAIGGRKGALRYSDHFEGNGAAVFARACELGVRAVWSRRAGALRREGRNPGWKEVVCRGRRAQRDPHTSTSTSTSTNASTNAGTVNGKPVVAGVPISSPAKVMYPAIGLTKLALAKLYEAIAEHAVPHVQGRPLTLVRCDRSVAEGCSYMRHARAWGPPALRRITIQEKTKVGEYLVADDAAGVVSLVQMDVVEWHTWNVTDPELERPDRIVLDLDPHESVAWTRVVDAARALREILAGLGLESFVKTTGGVGLHVVVPLAPDLEWGPLLRFSRAVSQQLVRRDPRAYTISMPRERRGGKILIDYLRNNRANTSIAAFSTRARPDAPISVPIAWEELSPRLRSDHFTVKNLPRRLASLRRDPWERYGALRQRLSPAARRLAVP